MAHLLNDKYWDPEKPRRNPSEWLKTTYDEAIYALEHPELWECGPARDQGLSHKDMGFCMVLRSVGFMAGCIELIECLGSSWP